MQTIELTGGGQVREGRTEVSVPYRDTTFVMPLVGPNFHGGVMSGIDSQKLLRPTTAQVLALVDIAQQNSDVSVFPNLLERFKEDHLWSATENLSFSEGVLVYDNVDGKMSSDKGALQKLVISGDKRVRFVEPGFETGWMALDDALKNHYTIAQIGEDMLPVFERVARSLDTSGKPQAYVRALSGTSEDIKNYSAVLDLYGGLSLGGSFNVGDWNGFSSGVFSTGEASCEK
jgi:hypothetical protein